MVAVLERPALEGVHGALHVHGETLEDLDDRLADLTARLDEISRALASRPTIPVEQADPLPPVPPAPLTAPAPAPLGGTGRRWGTMALLVPLVVAGLGFAACALPALLGYRGLTVNGGSMEPAIPLGSMAFVSSRPAADISIGDVILVNADTGLVAGEAKARFLHRVERLRTEDGRLLARTRGDANPQSDPDWVELEGEIPALAWSVPLLGFLMAAVVTPAGWFGLVLLPGGLACIALLRSIWSNPTPE